MILLSRSAQPKHVTLRFHNLLWDIDREISTKFYSVDLFLFLTTHQPLPQNGHSLLMTLWGLSLDQIVGSTEFNNVLFLIEPTILVSLILASQETCSLFLFIAIFYAKYTNFKNIIRCHSTGQIRKKPGTFSSDRRPSRPSSDPQGPTCLTRVLPTCPTCPTLFHSPEFNLWIDNKQNLCQTFIFG